MSNGEQTITTNGTTQNFDFRSVWFRFYIFSVLLLMFVCLMIGYRIVSDTIITIQHWCLLGCLSSFLSLSVTLPHSLTLFHSLASPNFVLLKMFCFRFFFNVRCRSWVCCVFCECGFGFGLEFYYLLWSERHGDGARLDDLLLLAKDCDGGHTCNVSMVCPYNSFNCDTPEIEKNEKMMISYVMLWEFKWIGVFGVCLDGLGCENRTFI